MPTPRRHAELIKKWADDDSLVIQFKDKDGKWYDDIFPTWEDCYNFRIKPETIRYRVALLKTGTTVSVDDEKQMDYVSTGVLFKKWLTDWIEVEI